MSESKVVARVPDFASIPAIPIPFPFESVRERVRRGDVDAQRDVARDVRLGHVLLTPGQLAAHARYVGLEPRELLALCLGPAL